MNRLALFSLLLILGLVACNPLLEKSIKDKTITLFAPQDNDSLPSGQVTFWWNELEYAPKFRLQVVKPSFANTSQLILDTLVESTKFSTQLSLGDYEWRVRGENANSVSQYSTRKLRVVNVVDLTAQNLILKSPAAEDAFKDSAVTFKWYTIATATEYFFRLEDKSGTAVYEQTVYGESISIVFNLQGEYTWKVKAKNATTETQFSGRTVYIDWTAPSTPVLVSPIYNDTVNTGPVTFSWDRITTSISPQTDSIMIYTDSLIHLFGTYTTSTNSFQLTLPPSSGYYFWRVNAADKAGNYSANSGAYKLKVK